MKHIKPMLKYILTLTILLAISFYCKAELEAPKIVPPMPTITYNNCGMAVVSYLPSQLPVETGCAPISIMDCRIRFFLQSVLNPLDSLSYYDSNTLNFTIPPGNYLIAVKYLGLNVYGSNKIYFSINPPVASPSCPFIDLPNNVKNKKDYFGGKDNYTATPGNGANTLRWYKGQFNSGFLYEGLEFKPSSFYQTLWVASHNSTTGNQSLRVQVYTDFDKDKMFKIYPRISGIKNLEQIMDLNWNEAIRQKSYLDNANRPYQIIDIGITPNWANLITPILYDNDGNSPKNYLPYSKIGEPQMNRYVLTEQHAFYNSPPAGISLTSFPFSETVYEKSSLNRPLEQSAPGDAWKMGAGHTSKNEYIANIASEVRWFKETAINSNLFIASTFYPENTLNKLQSTDENGNRTINFTDLAGKKICDKQEVETNVWLSTYYIYNSMNQLKYILQPAGFKKMVVANNYDIATQLIDFCFQYTYDERGRVIVKKVPGGGLDVFIYDKADRIRFSQNAVLKETNKWMYYKYDVQGRVVSTGIHTNGAPSVALQSYVNSATVHFEKRTDAGYSNLTLPISNFVELTTNYYDDYNFENTITHPSFTPRNEHVASARVFGMLTRTSSRLLKSDGGYSTELYNTYFWYDEEGRPIQTMKEYPNSRSMLTQTNFSFTGLPTVIVKTLKRFGSTLITTKDSLGYDHADRLLDIYFTVNNDNEMHIVNNKYNELGQLMQKFIHYDWMWSDEAYLQTIDYRYNTRGWLTKINNSTLTQDPDNASNRDAFGEELFYDNANFQTATGSDAITAKPQYNGNIAMVQWANKAPNSEALSVSRNTYVYDYDKANRLKSAKSGFENLPQVYNPYITGIFNEEQTFDDNGNILTIKRNNTFGLMDDLTLTYSGNRIQSVNDAILANSFDNDFEDNGSNLATEYMYDLGGNLKEDNNKALKFNYNFLNLPSKMFKSSGTSNDTVKYLYDVAGTRLQKITQNGMHEYIEGFEFDNNLFQFGPTAEGRFRNKKSNALNPQQFVFDYDIKDHLGNVRVILTNEFLNTTVIATEEEPNNTTEMALFLNIQSSRGDKDEQAPSDTTYFPDDKVSELDGVLTNSIGFARTFEMNAGDIVDFSVKYFQEVEPLYNKTNTLISGILGQLKDVFFINNPNFDLLNWEEQQILLEMGENTYGSNSMVSNFLSSLLKDPTKEGYTRSQLVYLYLDREFNLVENMSGSLMAEEVGILGTLAIERMQAERDGFMYIFVVNETTTAIDFDNLIVIHKTGTVLEINDYYPFGLKWYSNGTSLNKYKFGGKELQTELNLNTYDFHARQQDPQLGRFWGVDQKSDEQVDQSSFNYTWNNPVNMADPDGKLPVFLVGAFIGAATDIAIQSITISLSETKTFANDFSGSSVLISTIAGATGAGLASKLGKMGTLAKTGIEGLHDMGFSALSQYSETGSVSISNTLLDAVGGKIAGDIANNKVTKSALNSPEGKVLSNQADRAKRVNDGNPRPSREAKFQEAQSKANNYVEKRAIAGSTAASGFGADLANRLLGIEE